MQWYLLLLWAQGLRQTPLLAAGAMAGRLVTAGNISAEEGDSVTLQCHFFSSTAANVTQVEWRQQDRELAIHNANFGWHIFPAFREWVVPGPRLGLTLHSLRTNNTGEYFCIYHTFPDGIYTGRLSLEVLRRSGAARGAGFQILVLGVTLLAVIVIAVPAVVTLSRKRKLLHIRSAESGLRRGPPEQGGRGPSVLSPPGAEAQSGEDYEELHDYFNVLSYRRLGDLGFPAETG